MGLDPLPTTLPPEAIWWGWGQVEGGLSMWCRGPASQEALKTELPFRVPRSAGGRGAVCSEGWPSASIPVGLASFCTLDPGSPALASGLLILSRPPDPHCLKVSLGQASDALTHVAGGELPEGPACGWDQCRVLTTHLFIRLVLQPSEGRNQVWVMVASQAPHSWGPPTCWPPCLWTLGSKAEECH